MTAPDAPPDLDAAAARADAFRALHRPGAPLLMPNPWDAGSARVLASLGFAALATTSSGFAATLGRPDGSVTLDEALAHAAVIAAATDVPVSADFEMRPPGSRRTSPGPRAPGWPAARSRTSPAAAMTPSTPPAWPPSGWPRRRRPRTAARSGWS
jgi:hypothetical protein